MTNSKVLVEEIKKGGFDERLLDIYVDSAKVDYQKNRYIAAIEKYESLYGEDEVMIFSAPGRTEVGGNHTDHQHGEVLAASINLDAIAIVKPLEENVVKVVSDGYSKITVSLDKLELVESEKESTRALIKGVLAGLSNRGYKLGGFQAYVTSDVLIGAGLSSSAAFETLMGTIISGLYNDMKISPVEIAIIGQYAENVYFGKPCGLMDQMACSVGSLVHIDFADPAKPVVEKVEFDMEKYGYSLCITDTKGSHCDLTGDYAAVPAEMKAVAKVFGKEVLREISFEQLMSNIQTVREQAGDRGVLRAIHFIEENKRVRKEVEALKENDIATFLKTVSESGNSSFRFLQNVYTVNDVQHQNVSVALAASEVLLGGDGVCRVHGGGFAGTIQAFVKNEKVDAYRKCMDNVFGKGACGVLKIRRYGGMRVL
ncbi:MAG: galactokinase [Lachnospiraceae bacterium]